MLKILFLFSLAITVVLTALQLSGFQVLDLIIIMIIINFLSLAAYIEVENRKTNKESKDFLSSKLGTIEKVCTDIFNHVTSPNPGFEAKLEKQKNDVSYILDKISHRSLELEERLNSFGKVLVDSLSEKKEEEGEKIRTETEEEKEADEEETLKEESEKPAESFSVGEIVYVKDEEDKG